MSTLHDLISQRDQLNEQIESARKEAVAVARKQILELMEVHGLTLSDLSGRAPKASGKSTGKVAAKYRDQATGDTWSGRGLQPKWLKAKLASGQKLEDFAVN